MKKTKRLQYIKLKNKILQKLDKNIIRKRIMHQAKINYCPETTPERPRSQQLPICQPNHKSLMALIEKQYGKNGIRSSIGSLAKYKGKNDQT